MTHLCSNCPIEIIVSITFFNSLYLAHCTDRSVLLSVCKQRYFFLDGGGFVCVISVVVLFGISVNHVITELGENIIVGARYIGTVVVFPGIFKMLYSLSIFTIVSNMFVVFVEI